VFRIFTIQQSVYFANSHTSSLIETWNTNSGKTDTTPMSFSRQHRGLGLPKLIFCKYGFRNIHFLLIVNKRANHKDDSKYKKLTHSGEHSRAGKSTVIQIIKVFCFILMKIRRQQLATEPHTEPYESTPDFHNPIL
jgi:hypothetical protein